MKVSDRFVECLENEGVEYVFGLPGEENEDLLFSLEDSSIEFVPTRHEQGAAFMADVWGRLTGEAGVCLSTLGPGATNLITGVADANLDKSPLVAITGQGSLERLHQESHQRLDIVNMMRPVTKWNSAVSDPQIVCEVVRKAFKIAQMEKPGATHIELSEDVARAETEAEPIPVREPRRPDADHKAVSQAIDRLKDSRRPLIIAGNGAIRKRSSRHLRQFVDRHGVPVVATFMGKGAISDRSSQSLYTLGLGFRDHVMDAVEEADLILTVGYDIAEYAPEMWNPHRSKPIVHIDFEPAEVYTHYQPDVEIVCDISGALWELNQRCDTGDLCFDRDWFKPVRSTIRQDIQGYELEQQAPFSTPAVLRVMRQAMRDDDLLISDVGSHKMWIARNFPTYVPNGCIISNGLASMGIALPGGIAASLCEPDRNIVCGMGDGGFLMNCQELETARRLGVSFTCVIFNDDDYGLISWKQRSNRGRSTGTRIGNPNFEQLATSFGVRGYSPRTAQELSDQLTEAFGSDGLHLIEVPVDPSANVELQERLQSP